VAEPPKPSHADRKAQVLRERALELLADASLHAERINAAAEKLGLTPDLLDGIGDHLYEAAVAQLDIASKILERSQAIAERLFELGARRVEPSRLVRVDVAPCTLAQVRFVVRNPLSRTAEVVVDAAWDGGSPLQVRIGRPRLAAGRETSVEIATTEGLAAGQVYAGCARVRLTCEGHGAVELARHDFEIWVSGGAGDG
jgi:hypothetical protein